MTEQEYHYWKQKVTEYEKKQSYLSSIKGKTKCPFCSGSKTTPLVRANKSQECDECDESGMIENRVLAELDLL